MSDLPADTLTTTIANVLAEHSLVRDDYSPLCACGSWRDKRDHDRSRHRAHVAAAVVSVLATHNQHTAADALRDAADDIQALHPGETKNSVIWLRARADRLAAVSPTPPTHKEQA